MRAHLLLIGGALALTSGWALAQRSPESLLPPGFDEPAPKAAPRSDPAPRAVPRPSSGGPARSAASPAIEPLPGTSAPRSAAPRPPAGGAATPVASLPSLEALEKLSPEELETALEIKPRFDIPPAARRSMQRVGIVDDSEGGLSATALAGQNASLVRAVLAGNKGRLVSRWGHILLRRALASRYDAPAGMNPADFAALRAALLVRMGEGDAARALVQDVDAANYTADLTRAAFDSYVATADLTGACPVVALQGDAFTDPQWNMMKAICAAFQGDGQGGLTQLDRQLNAPGTQKIDVLLAQKYAGAAGKARRAVTIEWDNVEDMTPWRYALAIAVGLEPPETVMKAADRRFAYTAATAPMLGLDDRAAASDLAGGAGILSSAALVDLYSEIYADGELSGNSAGRATKLHDAYVAGSPAARLEAMKALWSSAPDADQRYSRQVLTAYAAARLPVEADFAESAGDIVASMLTAGLDANAMRWASAADVGSDAWAQLVLAAPMRSQPVPANGIDSFRDADQSQNQRKSAFLLAGLAALGRISAETQNGAASALKVDFTRQTRWTRLIDRAAEVRNPAMVALLAGVGMQGDSWAKMTPLHLYHIVSALKQVGFDAEARMIAAEAVARG